MAKGEKERVRKALGRAKEHREYIDIARQAVDAGEDVDLFTGALRQFASRGSIGPARLRMLTEWLVAHNYLEGTPMAAGKPSPSTLLAERLRHLADLIDSADIPKEVKAQEFIGFVGSAHESLDAYAKLLKEGKD